MQFSRRTGWECGENDWAAALRAARASGLPLVDLTVSNPTACGLGPSLNDLLAPLADEGVLRYSPEPLGMQPAREAVAGYYRDHGAEVPVEHICLTTSTSEAYSFLFRLLCDPDDEVLVAQPSYPLFDLLAQLDDVVLRSHCLLYDPGATASNQGAWQFDLPALASEITSRTRALIVVHPNNPTGNFVATADRRALCELCAQKGIALIVDEVFLDYAIDPAARANGLASSFLQEASSCACFVLSGLSKICALPQMKLSWIAAAGPERLVYESMRRLEIVADTYLSVNAPTQFALPHWLRGRFETQELVGERLQRNLKTLDGRLAGSLGGRLEVQGGWTVVLRVPAEVEGEAFALSCMKRDVLVQPGSFYGLSAGHCVLSLLTPPELWMRGLDLLPLA